MLLLILHQLAVCISLFTLLVLSVDCVGLLRSSLSRPFTKPALGVVIVLWLVALFHALYEGIILAGKTNYSDLVASCGLLLVSPVFCMYFRRSPFVRKELWIVLCSYLVSIINIFIPDYYIGDILYNVFVVSLALRIAKELPYLRWVKRLMKQHLVLISTITDAATLQITGRLRRIWLDSSKEEIVNEVLDEKIYQSGITIDELARRTGINRTYLSRYFNQQQGMPFRKYVNAKRVVKVEGALQTSDDPVMLICEDAGISSSTFYLAFKANYKMTPGQWRKMNKENVSREEEGNS